MIEEKQKQIQEKYANLQLLEQQMKHVQKQLQLLEQQIQELNTTKEAIKDIATVKTETEILVPISSGIFFKGQLKDNKEMIVNVGADTAVNKSIEETGKLIETQLEEITNFQQELTLNMQKLGLKAQELQQELATLVK